MKLAQNSGKQGIFYGQRQGTGLRRFLAAGAAEMSFKPPYSSAHINTVLRLYEKHRLSTYEIQDATGISKQVAFEWCRYAGILRSKSEADRIQNGRRNGKGYELLELKAVVLSVAGSKSDHDIAKELGVARRFVGDSRKRHGFEIDPVMMSRVKSIIANDRGAKIWKAYRLELRGWKNKSVAKEMSCSEGVVSVYLRDVRLALGTGSWETVRMHVRFHEELLHRQIEDLTTAIEFGLDRRLSMTALRNTLEDVAERLRGRVAP